MFVSVCVPPIHVSAESALWPARTVQCVSDEAGRKPHSRPGAPAARSRCDQEAPISVEHKRTGTNPPPQSLQTFRTDVFVVILEGSRQTAVFPLPLCPSCIRRQCSSPSAGPACLQPPRSSLAAACVPA